jgi:ribosomal protein L32
MLYAGDDMPDEWDSSPVWAEARERARADVHAIFAPTPQTCPSCGHEDKTAARTCPHCGASYVQNQPKLSQRAKLTIAAAAAALAVAGGIAWLLVSPAIDRTKRHEAQRAAAEQQAFIRSETRRLTLDERLHTGGAARPRQTRAALVTGLESSITADARARVKAGTLSGPILNTTCEAVNVGPLVPSARRGGYECVAVQAQIAKSREPGGVLGYPFWAIVDYRRGTFAWCKVNPRGGERAVQSLEPVVPPPRGCNLGI